MCILSKVLQQQCSAGIFVERVSATIIMLFTPNAYDCLILHGSKTYDMVQKKHKHFRNNCRVHITVDQINYVLLQENRVYFLNNWHIQNEQLIDISWFNTCRCFLNNCQVQISCYQATWKTWMHYSPEGTLSEPWTLVLETFLEGCFRCSDMSRTKIPIWHPWAIFFK